MGVFDEAAAESAQGRLLNESAREWKAYGKAAEAHFAATELPVLLREFWTATESSGKQRRADGAVGVGFYSDDTGAYGTRTSWFTDANGYVWHAPDNVPPEQLLPQDNPVAFARCFGLYLGGTTPVPMDSDAVMDSIRSHWMSYLKSQL